MTIKMAQSFGLKQLVVFCRLPLLLHRAPAPTHRTDRQPDPTRGGGGARQGGAGARQRRRVGDCRAVG